MITVQDGQLGINKATIAKIFSISRSAVTQSSKKHASADQDFAIRVYKYLQRVSKNKNTLQLHINDLMVDLLQDVRDEVQRRDVGRKSAGRKCVKLSFTPLKRLIRAIVSELLDAVTNVASAVVDVVKPTNDASESEVQEKSAVSIPENAAGFGFF